ncbi:C-type lectin domain family 4 member K-like isoform X1 [Neocloeon triangulifer]|uniref:C-type lectin domain family 4 member K-like isoform X1 n=1 Tax=Neocloeon triangulifer TaxID=2078957 RepID=UPI00286F8912|nr:C-type lectin domain family 4 member K-like isoform X1 [Neocloeon triangulifer]
MDFMKPGESVLVILQPPEQRKKQFSKKWALRSEVLILLMTVNLAFSAGLFFQSMAERIVFSREVVKAMKKVDRLENELVNATSMQDQQIEKLKNDLLCTKVRTENKLTTMKSGNSYYFHNDSMVNWTEAKKYCEHSGMHLATIKDENELQSFGTTDNFWLSASDMGQSAGHFLWGDGSELKHISRWWKDGEPNAFGAERETCVSIYKSKLFDQPCSDKTFFVCQLPDSCK